MFTWLSNAIAAPIESVVGKSAAANIGIGVATGFGVMAGITAFNVLAKGVVDGISAIPLTDARNWVARQIGSDDVVVVEKVPSNEKMAQPATPASA